jgi:hypothetical protein
MARSAAISCRPSSVGAPEMAGTTEGSLAPTGISAERGSPLVRDAVGRGAGDPTLAWGCEAEDSDPGDWPWGDIQLVHTTAHTIAATRRMLPA